MKPFLETLNYASSNEDGRSEIRALEIRRNDTILCITGSGARPLDLAIMKPARIISIDFNPCQNFLLELKISAMGLLDYEEVLQFIGIDPSKERIRAYRRVRESLSSDARHFWDNNLQMIEKGIIYQGRWERYFSKLAQVFHVVYPTERDVLFNCKSMAEQSMVWREMRNKFMWQAFFRLCTSELAWKHMFGDPGFYAYVEAGFSAYDYLDERLTSFFNCQLAGESPFATLLFYGRYDRTRCLPLYLQKRHFETLKDQLPCIQILTQSLQESIATYTHHRPNKYSLSDFASYTNLEEYRMVWQNIVRVAPSGARICERQFLVKRELPDGLIRSVMRHSELEEELAVVDDSIFYTFVVAEIGTN